jgi:hypothetical protein
MRFIATIGKHHRDIEKYSEKVLVDYVNSFPERNAIVASYSRDDVFTHGLGTEILALSRSGKKNLIFCGPDISAQNKIYEEILQQRKEDPDFVTRKNILEMMDTTIWAYLSAYWTSPEKVNSDISDSIFSARRLMISSFVPEVDDKIWEPNIHLITENIKKQKDYTKSIILVDVQYKFFIEKKFEEHPPSSSSRDGGVL